MASTSDLPSGTAPSSYPAVGRAETFAHEADIGVRGIGPTLEAAFEQAASALTSVVTDPGRVRSHDTVEVSCDGDDLELLLFDFLQALIYEMATRKLLFGRFEVRLRTGGLSGLAHGEPIDLMRHEPAVEVKGATLTELAVRRDEHGDWVAQCVVDV